MQGGGAEWGEMKLWENRGGTGQEQEMTLGDGWVPALMSPSSVLSPYS